MNVFAPTELTLYGPRGTELTARPRVLRTSMPCSLASSRPKPGTTPSACPRRRWHATTVSLSREMPFWTSRKTIHSPPLKLLISLRGRRRCSDMWRPCRRRSTRRATAATTLSASTARRRRHGGRSIRYIHSLCRGLHAGRDALDHFLRRRLLLPAARHGRSWNGCGDGRGLTGLDQRGAGGLEADAAGNLYSLNWSGSLFSLDKTTGEATYIGNAGLYYANLAFDNSGTLWAVDGNGSLWTIDPATGVGTYRTYIYGLNGSPSGLVVDPVDNSMYVT